MTHRKRFHSLLRGDPVDRVPLYFFGTWRETKIRWMNEGLTTVTDLSPDAGPQVPGMDPDWEESMWGCQGLVRTCLIGDGKVEILGEDDDFVLKRNEYGASTSTSSRGAKQPSAAISSPLHRGRPRRFSSHAGPPDPSRGVL
jgi:hypothetical protein